MSTQNNNGLFASLYRNRVTVTKNSTPIVNLSLLFSIIAVLTAPWLVIGGAIAAMALGYKIGFSKNAKDFNGNFNEVVEEAKDNVRTAVNSFTNSDE